MTHFGLLCPALTGHLNPMLPLGQELQRRSHRVTLIGILDAQARVLAAGLEFRAIAEQEYPAGTTKEHVTKLGQLSGFAAFRYTIKLFERSMRVILENVPQVSKEIGVEALLIDQLWAAGGTVAEYLQIPFITICNALMLNQDFTVPPFNVAWNYQRTRWAYLRNRVGYCIFEQVTKPIRKTITEYRRAWKLPLNSHDDDLYSQLAQISQEPAEFEFPRQNLPRCFHFTGPYHYSTQREPVPFPYERLNGKPLIYASMGTVQNRLLPVFQEIASACGGLDAQLVISLGGAADPDALASLPGNPIVVQYAPQLELLKRATLTITHAGLNTTLESLRNGVPMVAIPITNDQPGVAARIVWTGTGEMVALKRLSSRRLREAIARVLSEESYQQNAQRLQAAIERSGGVKRAADIIEQAVSTGQPVLASH